MRRTLALVLTLFLVSSLVFVPHVSAGKPIRMLWYRAEESGNAGFIGGDSRVIVNLNLMKQKYPNIQVDVVNDSADIPSDWYSYDILVIADTDFPRNLTEFRGKVLITLDSGISTLFYWFTGDPHGPWSYCTGSETKWIVPDYGTERVSSWDAGIYKSGIEGISWIKPRLDVLYAVDNSNPDCISVGLFEVKWKDREFYWVHLGPYDAYHPDSPDRQTLLVGEFGTKVLSMLQPQQQASSAKTTLLNLPGLTFLYYHQYGILMKQVNESLHRTDDNSTIEKVRIEMSAAQDEYKKALAYGPILRNLSNIHVFIHLRKAVIYLREALSFLS